MAEIEVRLSPLTFPEPPPIVVTEEYFVIGRETQMFRVWKDARLKRLSREHARLEINGPAASICDLGSTNGTKINNHPLTAYEPCPIRDGDVISFANAFKYEVKIVRCKPAEDTVITRVSGEPVQDGGIVKNKTMFIASADSYLDMLCEEDERNGEKETQQIRAKNERLWIVIAAIVTIAVLGGTTYFLVSY
ncbi:MAG: FHA domain-containing protein [Methylococcaceae bacterium]|nr:FHA domain-containing protein [Methylococcaceae bacterium]MCI0732319.1 FHA domain-containing protein [Methylococcaceae bacterium]